MTEFLDDFKLAGVGRDIYSLRASALRPGLLSLKDVEIANRSWYPVTDLSADIQYQLKQLMQQNNIPAIETVVISGDIL